MVWTALPALLDVRTIRYRFDDGKYAKAICLPSGDQLGKAAVCAERLAARCDAAAVPAIEVAPAASAAATMSTATTRMA